MGGDRQTELIDVLPLEFQEDTTEAQAQQASLEAKFQVIYTWLQQELDALDIKAHRLNPHSKQMLEMYYGQGLKQTPIAVALNLNQGTVARTLAKIQAILAGRFIEWLAENSMPSLESHDIQTLGDALEQWLHYLYQHPTSMTEEH